MISIVRVKIFTMYQTEVSRALQEIGYLPLLPIQKEVIPHIENNEHLFIQAKTGSGKTASYLIPLLSHCKRSLIIAPTRELALQIETEALRIASYTKIHSACLIGGIDYTKQENRLRAKPELIIATAGRLLDLSSQNKIDFSRLETVVLDEADQIIHTGQYEDVKKVLDQILQPIQLICLSATWEERLSQYLPESYVTLQFDENRVNEDIVLCHIQTEEKTKTLRKLLQNEPIQKAIIFVNHKSDALYLEKKFLHENILCASFSSAQDENKRIRTIRDFTEGKIRILISTDAGARGLDIPDLSHIIHYDLPFDKETYIHRSGRTAHQQNQGISIAFLNQEEAETETGKYILSQSIPFVFTSKNGNNLTVPLAQTKKKSTNTQTILIRAGRKDKIRRGDIVGSLCAILPFEKIGTIEIQDHYSLVTILDEETTLLQKINPLTIKGKKRKVEQKNA